MRADKISGRGWVTVASINDASVMIGKSVSIVRLVA